MMHQQPINGGDNSQEEEISTTTVASEATNVITSDKPTKPLTGWGSEKDGVWF